jgi:DNA-directed RNA polymerase subunit RPC12/RpoP
MMKRMRRAIRKGYAKNCTLEVHNGVLLIALAKKTVKDQCLSCGAPLTGVADENSRCSYCGNLIMGVLEKR